MANVNPHLEPELLSVMTDLASSRRTMSRIAGEDPSTITTCSMVSISSIIAVTFACPTSLRHTLVCTKIPFSLSSCCTDSCYSFLACLCQTRATLQSMGHCDIHSSHAFTPCLCEIVTAYSFAIWMQAFDPRCSQLHKDKAARQQANANSELMRMMVGMDSNINFLSAKLEATKLGSGGEGQGLRQTRTTPTSGPANEGSMDNSKLDGQQVRALTQFGKVICGLKVTQHTMLSRRCAGVHVCVLLMCTPYDMMWILHA